MQASKIYIIEVNACQSISLVGSKTHILANRLHLKDISLEEYAIIQCLVNLWKITTCKIEDTKQYLQAKGLLKLKRSTGVARPKLNLSYNPIEENGMFVVT